MTVTLSIPNSALSAIHGSPTVHRFAYVTQPQPAVLLWVLLHGLYRRLELSLQRGTP